MLTDSSELHRPIIERGKPYERYMVWISNKFLHSIGHDSLRAALIPQTGITAIYCAPVLNCCRQSVARIIYHQEVVAVRARALLQQSTTAAFLIIHIFRAALKKNMAYHQKPF